METFAMDDRSRPSVGFDEDDDLYIRASALGSCVYGLAAAAQLAQELPEDYSEQMTEPPPFMRKAMDESASLEEQAFQLFLDKLDKYKSGSWMEPVAATSGRIANFAYLQGAIDRVNMAHGVAVEIKVMAQPDQLIAKIKEYLNNPRPSQWLADNAHSLAAKYIWQMAAYAEIHERIDEVYLAVAEKESGGLTGRVHVVFMGYLPNADSIAKRVKRIRDLAAEPQSVQCESPPVGWCPFEFCHPDREEIEGLDPQEMELYLLLKEKAAEISKEISTIRDKVVRASDEQEVSKGRVADYDVTVSRSEVEEKKPRKYTRTTVTIKRRDT